jgi:ABC-2 type transport system permease protein
LARFFRLVKNEYLKIILKVSTWIMLIIVALTAVGIGALAKISQKQMERYYASEQNDSSEYFSGLEQEISYLKQYKPEGYQQDIQMYEIQIQYEIGVSDWRQEPAAELASLKGQYEELKEAGADTKSVEASIGQYDTIISKNDWKAYCNLKCDLIDRDADLTNEQKEIQKWGYQYRLDHNIPYDSDDWKSELINSIASSKQVLQSQEELKETGGGFNQEEYQKAKEAVLIGEYQLKNDIPLNVADSDSMMSMSGSGGKINFWAIMAMSVAVISIISMLIIVIAGSSVANEFSNGTIKFLLINPVTRGKILMSKYAAIISFSFVMLILFYLMSALSGIIFFGVGDLGAPYLYVSSNEVKEMSGFLYMAWRYLLGSPSIIIMATLAFAISSLVRSSALAIGVGVFVMLAGSGITQFMKLMLNLDWSRYFVFANTDLNGILTGNSIYGNHTVTFALCVLAVHMVVFLLTAWDGFTRREV